MYIYIFKRLWSTFSPPSDSPWCFSVWPCLAWIALLLLLGNVTKKKVFRSSHLLICCPHYTCATIKSMFWNSRHWRDSWEQGRMNACPSDAYIPAPVTRTLHCPHYTCVTIKSMFWNSRHWRDSWEWGRMNACPSDAYIPGEGVDNMLWGQTGVTMMR